MGVFTCFAHAGLVNLTSSLCSELRRASGLHAAQVPVRLRPASGVVPCGGLPQACHLGFQPHGKAEGRFVRTAGLVERESSHTRRPQCWAERGWPFRGASALGP